MAEPRTRAAGAVLVAGLMIAPGWFATEASGGSRTAVIKSRFALANRCLAIESVARRRFVAADGSGGYRADRQTRRGGEAFYAKPTGLGTYLLYDRDRKLVSVSDGGGVGRADGPGELTEWAPRRISRRSFS